jgi:WD40-like Beta Propeller Repeat
MRKLAWAALFLAACSSSGRTTGSTSGGTNGTNGGTNGTSGTNGSGGGQDLAMPYNGPDMAQPTLPPDSTVSVNGAPGDASNQFGGAADPAAAPTLVYPPDGVLVPPNLNELEIQFTPAAGTSLFEVGFTGPNGLNLRVYTTCVTVGTGCGYLPDAPVWNTVAQAGRDDTVKITVRAVNASGGVGSSAARNLSFAEEDLQGGLYYWAAAQGGINRYDFGLRGQKAEAFYTPSMSGAMCNGCHALSRDGSRIAVGLNIPGPATLRVLDVASRATLFESAGGPGSSGGSNFEALTPDGKQVLTSQGGNLVLQDAATGAATGATISNGTMPDFAADGSKVVFARAASSACPLGLCGANPGVDSASLFVAPFSGGTFGAPVALVGGGGSDNYYYPSFSPDGNWVAFNHSATDSYDAADAKVLVVSSAGGTPADLTAVNSVALGNSWPKFAPFVHHFQGKTIFWLTFSSRRDYGLRLVNSTMAADSQIVQLWMVAVSPDRLNTPGDAGFPPFWLPFQDIATGNHIAQWTETVARMGCTDSSQCMQGEFCVGGQCIPQIN